MASAPLGCSGCWGWAAMRRPGPGCTSCAGRWSAPTGLSLWDGGGGRNLCRRPGEGQKRPRNRDQGHCRGAAEENGKGIGRIRLRRVKDVSADSLLPFVQGAVTPGAPSIPTAGAAMPADGDRLQNTKSPSSAPDPSGATRSCRAFTPSPPCSSDGCSARIRRRPAPASRLLPRRIHLPLQPPPLTRQGPALPQARRAGRRRRAGPLPRNHRHRPSSADTSNESEGDTPFYRNRSGSDR